MIGNNFMATDTKQIGEPTKTTESVHGLSISVLDNAIHLAARLERLVDRIHGQQKPENGADAVPTMPIPGNLGTARKVLEHAIQQLSYLETTLFNN